MSKFDANNVPRDRRARKPKGPKRIHRKALTSGFTTLPNSLLQDKSLSFRARGLLVMMLSMPLSWQTFYSWIQSQSSEGDTALRKSVRELEAAGYLTRTQERSAGRMAGLVWNWFSEPVPQEQRTQFRHTPKSKKSSSGDSGSGKAVTTNDKPEKQPSPKTRESKERTSGSDEPASVGPVYPAQWKPKPGTKDEKLARIRPPQDFPSEEEFDDFLLQHELDQVIEYRSDLYWRLCTDKWHRWEECLQKWVPIRDWKAFVTGLDETIESNRSL